MKIYDISVPISRDTPVYPGDAGFKIRSLAKISEGSPYNLSVMQIGTHTGTHVDPPSHFIPGGATVDQLPLEAMVGPAYVIEMMDSPLVGAEQLQAAAIPSDVERLLIKTTNGRLWDSKEFSKEFVYLTEDGAEWLIDRGVKFVGMDYLSVEKFGAEKAAVHLSLLGEGVVVAEGLDLREAPPGRYTLVFLPLKVVDADGAPARAVLLTD